MSVLKEVLKWSADRPAWQRDALRRLVETGEIVADDIPLLAEICKSSYGLVEPNPGNPLTAHHLSCSNPHRAKNRTKNLCIHASSSAAIALISAVCKTLTNNSW